MTQTATEKKKNKNQLIFDFSLARSPEKVADKKVPVGTYFRKQTFFNIDFRFRHRGFNEISRQAGINLKELSPGNVVVFLNTAQTQIIIAFSDQGMYHWNNGKRKIELRAIDDMIIRFNRIGKMAYEDGLADFLIKRGHGVEDEKVKKNSKLN
jgi:hypothetical protein